MEGKAGKVLFGRMGEIVRENGSSKDRYVFLYRIVLLP